MRKESQELHRGWSLRDENELFSVVLGVKDSSQRKPMFGGRKTQQVQGHAGELGLAGLNSLWRGWSSVD